jgi:hypothetical protein
MTNPIDLAERMHPKLPGGANWRVRPCVVAGLKLRLQERKNLHIIDVAYCVP